MKIDGNGEVRNDNFFVDTGNDEDISYVDHLSRPAIYPTPGQDYRRILPTKAQILILNQTQLANENKLSWPRDVQRD